MEAEAAEEHEGRWLAVVDGEKGAEKAEVEGEDNNDDENEDGGGHEKRRCDNEGVGWKSIPRSLAMEANRKVSLISSLVGVNSSIGIFFFA